MGGGGGGGELFQLWSITYFSMFLIFVKLSVKLKLVSFFDFAN